MYNRFSRQQHQDCNGPWIDRPCTTWCITQTQQLGTHIAPALATGPVVPWKGERKGIGEGKGWAQVGGRGGVRGVRGGEAGEGKGYPSWMLNSRTNSLITSSQTHMSTPEQVFIYHFSVSVQLNAAYLEWPRQQGCQRVQHCHLVAYTHTYIHRLGVPQPVDPCTKGTKNLRLLNRPRICATLAR